MAPFLSIIVPVYNCEEFLEECINSIIFQEYQNFECILVDDGSSDRSSEICDEYKVKDSRIIVIHKKNGGLVSARKAGLGIARGEYVGYVDADDFIHPKMYKEMCQKVSEDDADIVICNINPYGINGAEPLQKNLREGLYNYDELKNGLFTRMLYSGVYYEFGILPSLCNKIIRRNILYVHQMRVDEKIKLGEDAVCSYFCLLEAKKVWVLQEAFYFYRMNDSSMTHKKSEKRVENTLVELEFFLEEIQRQKVNILITQFYYYTAHMLTNIIYDYLRLGEYKSRKNEIYAEYKAMCASEPVKIMLQHINELKLPHQVRLYLKHMQKQTLLSYAYAQMSRVLAGLIRRIKEKISK